MYLCLLRIFCYKINWRTSSGDVLWFACTFEKVEYFHVRMRRKRPRREKTARTNISTFITQKRSWKSKTVVTYFSKNNRRTHVIYCIVYASFKPQFSFEDCNFNIQRSKENTARVVVWLMGVENSYTMEASFCGSSLGSRANTHLAIKDFEDIGQTFCETLLDYYNEDPRNVWTAFFKNINK